MPTPHASGPGYALFLGDCLDVMRDMPAESVDALITSPPYAEQRKSTYGGISESEYPAWTVAYMAEARRLLKPDGSAIINISPHVKNGQLSDYVLRTRLALRENGWFELDEIIWYKSNPMPTGSPRKPKRSWESLLWYGKHGRPFGNPKAMGKPPKGQPFGPRGAAVRNGWTHEAVGGCTSPEIARVANVVTMAKAQARDSFDHPAPFPWQLAEWCAKLICPPGGVILDPFSGSASTGVAAIRNGWEYLGIDSVAEYLDQSADRLNAVPVPLNV